MKFLAAKRGELPQIRKSLQENEASLKEIRTSIRAYSSQSRVDPKKSIAQSTTSPLLIEDEKVKTLGEMHGKFKSESARKRTLSKCKPTFSLISKLTKPKQQNLHDLQEHVKNIKSLQYNLQRIETRYMQDRKKNPYDPIAYPSFFFRDKGDINNKKLKRYRIAVHYKNSIE